jgi:hypothetical protein
LLLELLDNRCAVDLQSIRNRFAIDSQSPID